MDLAHYSKCTCINCEAENCGSCKNCQGKRMFGGDGRNKKRCLLRECLSINPHAAVFLGPTTSRSRTATSAASSTAISIQNSQEQVVAGTVTGKRKRGRPKGVTRAPPAPVEEAPLKRARRTKCAGCKNKGCVDCRGTHRLNNSRHEEAESKPRRQSRPTKPSAPEEKKPLRIRLSLPSVADTPVPALGAATHNALVDDGSAMEPFRLSSYLFQNDRAPQAIDNRKDPPPATTMYGVAIPPETPADVCSGCLGARADELDDHPILLCDGPNCGREYHLICCVPTLTKVPDVDVWLCRDCCPDGSTASLREYFDTTDKAKADHVNPKEDYVRYLLRKDSLEVKKPTNRIPESELSRGAMIHALAMCEPNHLARTRGGSERREALSTDAYFGKPIRLFDTVGSMYHTGRIVDSRIRGRETEFLVRFAAGKELRKQAYQHWIVLEEHALAVGAAVVWAQIPTGHWKPSILWLRNSRELIPSQHQLKESDGAIIYEGETQTYLGSPSKTKHKVSALARSFGDEMFAVVNVRDQSVDLNNTVATNAYLKDSENVIQFHMAKAELEEQERVRQWRGLKQIDPMGPAVFSSVDYYTLPSLTPTMESGESRRNVKPHALPCPNVSFGLDRSKILKMLQQRGFQPTKDLAATLSCELIPVNSRTLEAERLGRTWQ